MAQFGAQYLCFAPMIGQEEDHLPTYLPGLNLGALVKADLTVNNASGEVYGDDALDEKIEVFASGAIAAETTDMTDDAASMVYGATAINGEVHYNRGDTPPQGGLAYFKRLLRKGKEYYKAYWYPTVRASLGNDSAATRAGSIAFGNVATSFTVFDPDVPKEVGGWRITKLFDDRMSAKTWVKAKTNIAAGYTVEVSVSGNGSATPMVTCVPAGQSVVLSFGTADPTKLYDNGADKTSTVSAHKYTIANIAADHKVAAIFTA